MNKALDHGFVFTIPYIIKNHPETILNNEYWGRNEYRISKVNCIISALLKIFFNSNSNQERQMIFFLTHTCIETTRHWCNYSNQFCSEFCEHDGISIIMKYLKSRLIIDAYVKLGHNSGIKNKEIEYIHLNRLIRGSIGVLINLSRQFNNNSIKWKDCQAAETIMKLSEEIKHLEDNLISMYMLLATIATDEIIENNIEDLSVVISKVVSIIKINAQQIETGENLERVSFQFGQQVHDVSRVTMTRSWNLAELLKTLHHLAVNDKLKWIIYETHDMKLFIRTIVFFGNLFEVECALQLLWQLCFDSKILNMVIEDEEMFQKVKEYGSSDECEKQEIKKICQVSLIIYYKWSNYINT